MCKLEEYYNQNKDNELFLAIYKHIKNTGKLSILEEIVTIKPNFNITSFNDEYFNQKFLNNYSLKFLIDIQNVVPSNILESGIRDDTIKEKIIHFFNDKYISFISPSLIYSEYFSIELFDRLTTLFDKYEQTLLFKTFYLGTFEEIAFIEKTIQTPLSYINFKFILNHFSNLNYQSLIEYSPYLDEISFNNFIKSINNCFYFSNLTLSTFIELYNNYKYLFMDESVIKYQEQVTCFLSDKNRDNYHISCLNDLISFENIRYNYFQENKVDMDILCNSYFNLSYKDLVVSVNKYLNRNSISHFLTEKEQDFLKSLIYPNDNYLIVLKSHHNLLKSIEEKFKEVCKKNISDSLFLVKNSQSIINISSQFFTILAHRIKGFSNSKIANDIILDISNWDKNYLEGSYLSTSLIDQYYFGLISGFNYILGFDNIDSNMIIDMGYSDVYASMHLYRNEITNINSNFDLCTFFKYFSVNAYNEVTLKRFNNKKSIRPNEIIAFDEITEFAHEASDYFKVPIILIDSEKSALFMNNHNQELLYNKKIREYSNYLLKMYLSFRDNYYIISKFFNSKELNRIINNLMHLDVINQNDLLFFLKIIEKINDLNQYNEYGITRIETEEFIKKLRRV